ncbi:multi-sensor hybrid histidine kinase [Stylonychia lemnae]|uniref:Multi-sensor hybrid histidine kinase n=1 Tax=Stylonychia lemnae TaxID=5949 RepID=A0A077ZXE5_STYLE|nr:multi-sensor hybrid histidine kinase [Stylonychia lemnae]|eukprot:CDW74581.1 multi-sensor hybrid histidine kinase [Stylonychia lemnae]
MTFLFTIIIGKRLFIDTEKSYDRLVYHLLVIAFYFIAVKLHSKSNNFTRFVPIFIGVLSYFAHTRFLTYYNIQPNQYSVLDNQSGCEGIANQTLIDGNQKFQVQNVDINDMFRHIVVMGAFFINHIYIDIFLTVTNFDSLLLNGMTWGLLSLNTMNNSGLTISTKISVLTLAIFAFKFSADARDIKRNQFKNYVEQKNLNLQWMSIFKRLPIGILITRDNKVIHSNKKMLEILGKDQINYLDELDNSLLITQDEIGSIDMNMKKECGSFRNLIDNKNNGNSVGGGYRKMLGRVSKIRSDTNASESSDNNNFLSNQSSAQKKFKIGTDTFSFIFQKVRILNVTINLILFMDISQQEKLFAANLEKKYKNIFLSSISHSLRTPLNSLQLNNNIMKELLRDRRDVKDILEIDSQTHELLNYQINDVLEYSKLETGEFKPNYKVFPIEKFMRHIAWMFETQAHAKGLKFTVLLGKKIPESVFQDYTKLGQVLVNILSNAIKYTPEGQVKVVVEHTLKQYRKLLQIKVSDTGIGISSKNEVGQWFQNLSVIENVNQNGIGFGINISKRLINQLGGDLLIENNANIPNSDTKRGVTVTIEFPYRQRAIEESENDHEIEDQQLAQEQIQVVQSFHSLSYYARLDTSVIDNEMNINDEKMDDKENSLVEKLEEHTLKNLNTLLEKKDGNLNRIKRNQRTKSYDKMLKKHISLFQGDLQEEEKSKDVYLLNQEKNKYMAKKNSIVPKNEIIVSNAYQRLQYQTYDLEMMRDFKPCCNRILVIDDNPFNVKSIQLMLQHCYKMECDVAFSGQDAISLVEERLRKVHNKGCFRLYQLILTDINMPEMDGLQMTKRIRKIIRDNVNLFNNNQPSCAIWAITAMNETELEDMISSENLNGVSVKPMNYNKLGEILQAFIK